MEEKKIFIRLSCYSINSISSQWYIKGQNNGIGNILFQLASGLNFAHKNNAVLYVPSLNTYFNCEELKKENTIFRYINTSLQKEYDENKTIGVKTNTEYIFNYQFYNNMIFFEHFENYNNFDDYKTEILNYFRPLEEDKKYLLNKYPFIILDDISSIHVRRGHDYNCILSSDELLKHENCYIQMLDYMIKEKNIKKFFVLTNDKNYCKNIFDNNQKYYDITFYYSNERDYFDIWIISLIKNNIVSCSTLGWWGSYLNENTDKFVLSHRKIIRKELSYPDWNYIDD